MTIKQRPEDFLVEEILAPGTAARLSETAGPIVLYRLTKRGLGTIDALERLALKLRVPLERIGYAGLKDRHALTVQHVSIFFPRSGAARAPETIEMPGWKIERIGRLESRISAEDVSGNRFRVTVRGLSRRQCERMTEARRFLASPGASAGRTLRFVNYFGEQRFGSARHGRGFAARRLIEGDFEEALRLLVAVPDRKDSRDRKGVKRAIAAAWGDWEKLAGELPPCPERAFARRLAETGGDFRSGFAALPPFIRRITIEAYQSWLWNAVTRRFIAGRCAPPLIEIPSRFGDLVFPGAAAIPAGLAGTLIPLFSPETALEDPWRSSAEAVLAGEGLALSDLRIPGLRSPYFGEVSRPLFVDALEFVVGPVEADESRTGARRFKRLVRFFLPRGSYGTVLLGALSAQSNFR
ncbi:MAG: tRNA pseudouridine(13) synthase TruD [Candidatus Krumholzibacteriia bacterium]